MNNIKKIKKEKIVPTGKFVLVIPDPEQSHVRKSGLVTPNSVEQEPQDKGTVESVGPEVKNKKMKKGVRVFWHSLAGDEITFTADDDAYRILLEEEILGFLE